MDLLLYPHTFLAQHLSVTLELITYDKKRIMMGFMKIQKHDSRALTPKQFVGYEPTIL